MPARSLNTIDARTTGTTYMNARDHHFTHPPLVEVVLGLQFSPVAGISSLHLGQFAGTLAAEFPKSNDAAPLDPHFEQFGEPFGLAAAAVQRHWKPTGTRLQLRSDGGERLLQIQNGRFVLNWRRTGDPYPTFRQLQPMFEGYLDGFKSFVAGVSGAAIRPEQWEIMYLNHIPRGPLWSSVADWSSILPGLLGTPSPLAQCEIETCGGRWSYRLPDCEGRLHIEASHAALRESDSGIDTPVMVLQIAARGSAQAQGTDMLLADRMRIGHDAIVKAFVEITGTSAHTVWGIAR